MKFIVYGLNHVTAPISVREKYALAPDKVKEILRALKPQAPEAVFLSTCNRVEFYLSTDNVADSLDSIQRGLGRYHRLKPGEIRKYFYLHEDAEAFRHLFRVASSLDSMVVGEAQILGQVKEAYQGSREAGMAGSLVNGVFARAFGAAKRVRTQTEIARMPVNVSSVALDLARKIFSDLSQNQVLLLGAGEMSELTARYLVDSGAPGLFIANRTLEKAKALASELKGTALTLEEGLKKMEQVDIVLTAVGGGFRVGKDDVERAMKSRKGKSLFLIDTAVPRNVDPEAGRLESVYLYNIDDLSAIADKNRAQRQKAVEEAEAILEEEVDKLCSWLATLELVPTIVRLRERFEGIGRKELEEFLGKNNALSDKEKRSVERLVHDLTGKLLHDPTVNLKKIGDEADRFEFARMLNEIFSLDDEIKR